MRMMKLIVNEKRREKRKRMFVVLLLAFLSLSLKIF
jgi:hypothetical protein